MWAATALAGESGEADDLEPVDPVDATAGDEGEPGVPRPVLHRGGTALGRAVHAVLQSVDFDDPSDVPLLAAVEAAREGLTAKGDADEVARRAAGALASVVIGEARAAPRRKRWRELYVAAPAGPSAVRVGARALVEGYIDLLFEDERGELVVVDYKTDRATTAEAAAEVGARYRLQAGAYALAVGQVLRRPVGARRARLLRTRQCRRVSDRGPVRRGRRGARHRDRISDAADSAAARSSVTACSSPFGSRNNALPATMTLAPASTAPPTVVVSSPPSTSTSTS